MKSYLTAVIYGESKVGKTTLCATAPGPILVLDAEAGGMRFVEGKITPWNPADGSPPEGYDIYQVTVTSLADIRNVYNYLTTYEHPFVSIVVDSITEIQGRMVREEMTNGAMQQKDWGQIWIKMEDLIWDFRDLVQHEVSSLKMLLIIAGVDVVNHKSRPMLQGRMRTVLPYKVDICGYLDITPDTNGDPARVLYTVGSDYLIAGERVGGRIDPVEHHPNMTELFNKIFGSSES